MEPEVSRWQDLLTTVTQPGLRKHTHTDLTCHFKAKQGQNKPRFVFMIMTFKSLKVMGLLAQMGLL